MRKMILIACLAAAVFGAGTADAQSIKGRFGITGRIGLVNPSDSDIGDARVKPDLGFIGGGGFIYGVDDHVAAELEVTRSSYGSDFPVSGTAGDFGVTNVSLGAQYRFIGVHRTIVPYAGAGLDILINDYQYGNVDTTVGVHVSGGADYFFAKSVALTGEVKAVVAPETTIRTSRFAGTQTGNFDPSSVAATVGVRLFF